MAPQHAWRRRIIIRHQTLSFIFTTATFSLCTGSGQAATELASRYSHVIAQDASDEQLAAAERTNPRVEYQRATAEDTRLPDASVDLVTVAQALHWCALCLDQIYSVLC